MDRPWISKGFVKVQYGLPCDDLVRGRTRSREIVVVIQEKHDGGSRSREKWLGWKIISQVEAAGLNGHLLRRKY